MLKWLLCVCLLFTACGSNDTVQILFDTNMTTLYEYETVAIALRTIIEEQLKANPNHLGLKMWLEDLSQSRDKMAMVALNLKVIMEKMELSEEKKAELILTLQELLVNTAILVVSG